MPQTTCGKQSWALRPLALQLQALPLIYGTLITMESNLSQTTSKLEVGVSLILSNSEEINQPAQWE